MQIVPGADGLLDHSSKPLRGRLIALKDNICTIQQPTTCASKILRGYRSPFDATVVKKLQDAGGIVAGKTKLDEFGMGSHSTHSFYGPVHNPLSTREYPLSAGGSSGGSAVAVASGQVHAALGTDTGGSVRLPAAYNGIVGFKPSYGLVSRFGVVAYANSLDTVGVLARTTSEAAEVFRAIDGHDSRDSTSLLEKSRTRIARTVNSRGVRKSIRFGIPREYNIMELDPTVRDAWLKAMEIVQSHGHTVHAVSLPATKMALPAYYILAPAEASSNLAKFDGMRYGQRTTSSGSSTNPFAASRGAGLGAEVRRRILLGAYSLSASAIDNYFLQAQRVRKLVQEDFNRVFDLPHPLEGDFLASIESSGVDVLMSPTAPTLPPRLEDVAKREPLDTYRDDILTVPASLAGLPAISLPYGPNSIDEPGRCKAIGLQLTAQYGDEAMLFQAAQVVEELVSN